MPEAVLDGLRIVEASAFVAAPLGGMTLAQMGADVIRIDPLQGSIDRRRWPVSPDGTSLFWAGLNKSKRSVTLDLAAPEGRELAAAIVCAPGEDGGLLLTNLPPRGWLAHEALVARRADLIQLTLMGDRHGGSAVDYTINPRVGLPHLTGPLDKTAPVNHVLPAWDLVTGQMLAVGLLAAERRRRKTGRGQHVKLALEDVALAVMGHLGFIAEAQLGTERQPVGNDLFGAYGRDFLCADGQRAMVVGLTARQWKTLVEATGSAADIDALAGRLGVDLQREGERFKARDAISTLLQPWFAARSIDEVAAAFDEHGVCWGRYRTVAELVGNDPSCSTANPMFSEIDQPGIGRVLAPGIPLDFSAAPRTPATPAPQLGEHTEIVLAELLGTTQAEFGHLLERKLVGTPRRP